MAARMARLFKIVSTRPHSAPGTIAETEELRAAKARISVFDYTESAFEEKDLADIEHCFIYKERDSVTWINIEGMNLEVIRRLDDHFGIHPLVSEDIVHLGQRPKVEEYDDYSFIVVKMIYTPEGGGEIIAEQISLILGRNYVISFQERPGDVFDPIRDRIRKAKGRVRKMGADYLAYCLLDAVVDNYFLVLEKKGAQIEAIESLLLENSKKNIAPELHRHKSDVVFLRKQIWPLRELLGNLQREDNGLIGKTTALYLRDVYDHTVQVMDTIESFRDMLAGLHDIHLANISNRMNEIMKVLTMISTIFIPITFMAGLYGMNFDNMPELRWRWGYFILLGLMAAVAGMMLFFFKKKKWF